MQRQQSTAQILTVPAADRRRHQRSVRSGRTNMLWTLLLTAAAMIGVIVMMLSQGSSETEQGSKRLTVFCAAGLRIPVEEIAEEYRKTYDVEIELQFAGSNTLLNQLQVNRYSDADLYLAADDFYTDKAVSEGLAEETLPIAHQRPVIAVRKDSDQIRSIRDLLKDDTAVALGNPDQAAVGKAVRKLLQKIESDGSDLWTQLEHQVTEHGVFKPTVNEIANDVKIGAVDAAIVWDSTVQMPKYREDLKAVPVPELDTDPNLVSIAVLKTSGDPTAALKFARFTAARDRGLKTFQKYGTRPVEGDIWSEKPEISFFCGAVNRRAVEPIIEAFAEREDVTVKTTYNGCGTLTAQMKAIEGQSTDKGFPDVYMACDRYYLENVRDWFQDDVDVSEVDLVIAVPKGSDKVKTLKDLTAPDVRVAIGQPEQCTIGALTRIMLQEEGIYDELMKKQAADGVVVEKMSSAVLVPDVVAGHVDAAVVYITDALPNTDDIDIIRIDSDSTVAVQPFSIAKTSGHKYLGLRLFKRISDSADAFESAGFRFRLSESPADGPEGETP